MKRILFIEDDTGSAHVVKALYSMCARAFHGEVQFATVPHFEMAQASIDEAMPDIILCDLVLPPYSAEETISKIQRVSSLWPPIMILTGDEIRTEELRVKAISAGAVDFMLKRSVNRHPEELCERIYLAHLRNSRYVTEKRS